MKKLFVFLFALAIWNFVAAKTEVGIGIVLIDFDENTKVDFYASPLADVKPVKTLSFFDDHVHQVWKIKNYEEHKSWLKPEAYNPLYDLLAFRCVENKDGWMRVIVNNNSGLTYWLKESEVNKFTDWLSFLQKKHCIIKRKINMPILENPEENAKIIEYNGKDCFSIKSMKDEWIEITIPQADKSDAVAQRTGWVRWKKGNDMLINYTVGTQSLSSLSSALGASE
jgi:hypothetical protein